MASYLISGFEVKTKKIIFNIIFIVSFSIALAGLWEIFEFTADNLTGQDAQDFLLTGLDDTMYDLILATFGSILYGIYYYKKHR